MIRLTSINYTDKLVYGAFGEILFPKPLIIRRNFKYEIRLEPDLWSTPISFDVLSTEVTMKPDITVKFDVGPVLNDEIRGLIEDLTFTEVE